MPIAPKSQLKPERHPELINNSSHNSWQDELSHAVRDFDELLHVLALPENIIPAPLKQQPFPLLVTHEFLRKMKKGDAQDPLLLQILPQAIEHNSVKGYSLDPVGDRLCTQQPGLIQKYHGRALLTVTGACAIHCRYCFRRHFPYGAENPTSNQWQNIIDYLQQHADIHELILSGGDPLLLSDDKLRDLLNKLESVPHLKRLRIHTRLPVVLSSRFTPALIALFKNFSKRCIFVIHVNHANEIDDATSTVLLALHQAGFDLFNQSVLLKDINDDVDTLAQLSETLFACHVLPYYLHQLDKVQGAAHFEVTEKRALSIHQKLTEQLPGYLVPKLVKEVAGAAAKLPV